MKSQLNSSQHGAPPASRSGADLTAPAMAMHLQRGRHLRSEAFYRRIGAAIVMLGGAYRALRDGLRRHNARRTAVGELSRMNNHMLADIGIYREQIPTVVEGMLGHRASTAKTSPHATDTVAVSTATDVKCGCGAANDEHCPPLAA